MNIKLLFLAYANCRNCKYYLPHPNDFDDLAKCKKFKLNNQNENKIYYDYAEVCRKNNNKCGPQAKEFVEVSPK